MCSPGGEGGDKFLDESRYVFIEITSFHSFTPNTNFGNDYFHVIFHFHLTTQPPMVQLFQEKCTCSVGKISPRLPIPDNGIGHATHLRTPTAGIFFVR